MKRRAFIGDIHGCIDELEALYQLIQATGVEEIWHTGDLVDRGPDSGAVIQFCRENDIRGVLGNHESAILPYRFKFNQLIPKDPEKNRTCHSIRSDLNWDYLEALPPLHVFDDTKTILVHGGIYPELPLYAQPKEAIIRLQLIHRDQIGTTKWFGLDQDGISEEVNRSNGWKRWYEAYDLPYDLVYGHSVYKTPLIKKGLQGGRTIGIDTGVCYGGHLTAVILPELEVISIPAKKTYFRAKRPFNTGESS
jgi:predicted phosphodiesterase